ncbi:MAG: TnsA endonuclease N-terminal domain-containing protein [Cyclobacteriaceae bacterium]
MARQMSDVSKIKAGRGTGTKENWIPWNLSTDGGVNSRKHAIPSILYNRELHALSTYEKDYFTMLEFLCDLDEIREQVPLDLAKTDEIRRKCGFKKVGNPHYKHRIMSTDCLLIFKNGKKKALSIKPESELNNPKVLQTAQIECMYWNELNVDWSIGTEKEIPSILITNINMIRPHFFQNDVFANTVYEGLSSRQNRNESLRRILSEISKDLKILSGTSWKIFKQLCAQKRITFDYNNPLNKDCLISEFYFTH